MASAPRSRCARDFFTVEHLLVAAEYPNAGKPDVRHGLLAGVQLEEKTVSKKRQSCIVMRHDDFDDGRLLHVVIRYC